MTLVYSVDRTDTPRLHRLDVLPESAQTAWHRARPDDEALAACSCRIVLNTEDRSEVGEPGVGRLCRRCFPPYCPTLTVGSSPTATHPERTEDD